MRYGYFFVDGLLTSGAMMLVYNSGWYARVHRRLPWILILSTAAALLMAILIR